MTNDLMRLYHQNRRPTRSTPVMNTDPQKMDAATKRAVADTQRRNEATRAAKSAVLAARQVAL